jgi:hypothetical protein
MPRFTIIGPLGPERLDYELSVADRPLEALWRVYAKALGAKAVQLEGNGLVFTDQTDRGCGRAAGGWWRYRRTGPGARW